MNHLLSRSVVFAAMFASAHGASAASMSPVDLMDAADKAASIETRHATGEGAAVSSFTTQYFGNGEILMSWDDKRVLLLCKKAAYLKLPGVKPEASKLTIEQRQMVAYEAMMAGFGGMAVLAGVTGKSVDVADDGSETRRDGEQSWAYGMEHFEVSTQRMPDGALRVRTRKLETINKVGPSSPDAAFSTDADQAARLAELAPVGGWTEVVIRGGARQARNDPAMSLKGWVSTVEKQAATVGEARGMHGCD